MHSDELKIIRNCLRKNSQAQRELYERYKRKWFRICLRYGKSKTDAADMLQEGSISIFSSLHQYDPNKGQFSTWSNRVLINAALRYLRKWKRLEFTESLDDHEDKVIYNDNVIETLSAKELTLLIQKLPDGYRIVFNMYVIEGIKHKEIAESLDISENTSRSQLLKARKMLQHQLEKALNH